MTGLFGISDVGLWYFTARDLIRPRYLFSLIPKYSYGDWDEDRLCVCPHSMCK